MISVDWEELKEIEMRMKELAENLRQLDAVLVKEGTSYNPYQLESLAEEIGNLAEGWMVEER